MSKELRVLLGILILLVPFCVAQPQDSTIVEEEEDYSMYDNLDFVAEGTKRFCTSKVLGLSPQKLISLGYDFQGGADLSTDVNNSLFNNESARIEYSHGLRLQGNIPVLSRNSIIIQANINYAEQNYVALKNDENTVGTNLFERSFLNYGLRTAGIGTTIFKPLDEENYLLFQVSGDNNGDYGWNALPDLANTRLSAAAIWGKKVSDRKMWGWGLSRTYRAGDLNYIPVFLLNWTSANSKWGAEMLLPARAQLRRSFNSRNLLLIGYELEGQTYRIDSRNQGVSNLELRRSELRFRLAYERSISGFIWLSFQAGFRYNYSFNIDDLPNNRDFFRGFFGDQPYFMENTLSNTFYSMVSINLVSP
ncbi:MAG: DUF6268 family outer membrane beta-barrel protein [Bacteroidia bacterium]